MNRGGFRALTGTMRPDGAFPGVVFRLDSKEGEVASHARELLVSLRLVLVLLDMEEVDGALSQHTVEITQDVAVAVLRGLAMDMATPDCFPLEPWTFLLTDVTWHPVHPSAWAPSLRVPSVPELLKFWASNVVCLSLRDNFVEVEGLGMQIASDYIQGALGPRGELSVEGHKPVEHVEIPAGGQQVAIFQGLLQFLSQDVTLQAASAERGLLL